MAFPAFLKKGSKKAPPFGGKETPGEEKAEGNPFAKPKKMAKGGKVMRGTGAAVRGKGTQGVV
jgi:RNA-splicing ligase RtcB